MVDSYFNMSKTSKVFCCWVLCGMFIIDIFITHKVYVRFLNSVTKIFFFWMKPSVVYQAFKPFFSKCLNVGCLHISLLIFIISDQIFFPLFFLIGYNSLWTGQKRDRYFTVPWSPQLYVQSGQSAEFSWRITSPGRTEWCGSSDSYLFSQSYAWSCSSYSQNFQRLSAEAVQNWS